MINVEIAIGNSIYVAIMQLRWRTLSFWFCLVLGTGSIWYWSYSKILPQQFRFNQPMPQESQIFIEQRARYVERERTDPEFHALMERTREEFREAARNKPPELPLPWYCKGPIELRCKLFLDSTSQTQSDVMGAAIAAAILNLIWISLILKFYRKAKEPDAQVLGSAGFATIKELNIAQKNARGGGTVVLGKVGGKLQIYNSDKCRYITSIGSNRQFQGWFDQLVPQLVHKFIKNSF